MAGVNNFLGLSSQAKRSLGKSSKVKSINAFCVRQASTYENGIGILQLATSYYDLVYKLLLCSVLIVGSPITHFVIPVFR